MKARSMRSRRLRGLPDGGLQRMPAMASAARRRNREAAGRRGDRHRQEGRGSHLRRRPGGRVRQCGADHSGRGDPPFRRAQLRRAGPVPGEGRQHRLLARTKGEYTIRLDGGGDRDTLVDPRRRAPVRPRPGAGGHLGLDHHRPRIRSRTSRCSAAATACSTARTAASASSSLVEQKPNWRRARPSLGRLRLVRSRELRAQLHPPRSTQGNGKHS